MALVVKADGCVTEGKNLDLFAECGTLIDFAKARQIIDGWIEIVLFPKPISIDEKLYFGILCDEEGKLKAKPVNHVASLILGASGVDDHVVGDVIFVSEKEVD